MSWDERLSDLLELLVRQYPDSIAARNLAQRADLGTRHIRFNDSPDNVWMAILNQARDTSNGLENLAREAQNDFPNIGFITLARQANEHAFKGPKLYEPAWKGPPTVDEGLEKIIGEQPTFLPISFLEVGLEMARTVARIVCPDGLGTGFLTRDNLLITNHHVISSPEEAREARIEFNFQETPKKKAAQVDPFTLAPEDGFATSPMEGGDDWTAVRVRGNPNGKWGVLELLEVDVKVNDYVNIIQHPGGLPKQIALYHNVVAYVGGNRVQYLTDTLPGSSGSPVFDSRWRVVALHHRGGHLTETGSGRKRVFFRNEGIHIKAVLKGLAEKQLY